MKKLFSQDWGALKTETIVTVGLTNEEIVSHLRKFATAFGTKEVIDAFEQSGRPREDEPVYSFVFLYLGRTILCLSHWNGGDSEDLATIVHETNHLVRYIMDKKGMSEESEASAYTQEYLFEQIVNKLGVKSKRNKRKNER